LREVARLLPESAEVHHNLGLALRLYGDDPEATRELHCAE
jgi:hypothetical protein